jgi:hypothetical protein
VWEEQEFVERELFPRHEHWGLPSADELRRGSTGMLVERIERRTRRAAAPRASDGGSKRTRPQANRGW